MKCVTTVTGPCRPQTAGKAASEVILAADEEMAMQTGPRGFWFLGDDTVEICVPRLDFLSNGFGESIDSAVVVSCLRFLDVGSWGVGSPAAVFSTPVESARCGQTKKCKWRCLYESEAVEA